MSKQISKKEKRNKKEKLNIVGFPFNKFKEILCSGSLNKFLELWQLFFQVSRQDKLGKIDIATSI